jgi:hypothetical protein
MARLAGARQAGSLGDFCAAGLNGPSKMACKKPANRVPGGELKLQTLLIAAISPIFRVFTLAFKIDFYDVLNVEEIYLQKILYYFRAATLDQDWQDNY